MAIKLETTFWCPAWEGDHIFDLSDGDIRVNARPKTFGTLYDQAPQAGFCMSALQLSDGCDVQGYFQSEKYYPNQSVIRDWYSFSVGVIKSASSKVDISLFRESVSLSLRLDSDYENTREFFPSYPIGYYLEALKLVPDAKTVIVFSDRPDLAKNFVTKIGSQFSFYFVENVLPAEQLWLMTQCGLGNILTNSTFAWWGAYLNANPKAVVVAPKEWVRPGVPIPIVDILPECWLKVRALHPVWDNFQVWRLIHPLQTIRRVVQRMRARR